MSLITTTEELSAVCARMAQHPYVTVDTEFLRETTFWPKLCVVQIASDAEAGIQVTPSAHKKCERCWHYREDVGHDAAHPELCGRCTSNLHGVGEARSVA